MGQMIRCPLTGLTCGIPMTVEEKSFFLAEAEKPDNARQWRREALTTVIEREYNYKIRSALDESDVNAFTCKICEMIQTCAYGIADITNSNPNVLLELGMMLALGKPAIILIKREQEQELKLPSDIIDKEAILFQEYIEIMPKLRKMVAILPPPLSPSNPIQDLEKIEPHLAEQFRDAGANIVAEFKKAIEEAKLDTISPMEEKKEIPPALDARLKKLEEKLEDMTRLGFATDAKTASLRGNYFYNQEKYEEALASFDWSLKLQPDDHDTLYNRGNTYAKLERYDDALADFKHALELKHAGVYTLYNLACCFSLQGKADDALTYLGKSIDRSKKYLGIFITINKQGIGYGRYKNIRVIAKTDEDFNNIRKDPRFEKLIEPD